MDNSSLTIEHVGGQEDIYIISRPHRIYDFHRKNFVLILKSLRAYRFIPVSLIPTKYVVSLHGILEVMQVLSKYPPMYEMILQDMVKYFGSKIEIFSESVAAMMIVYRLPESKNRPLLIYPGDLYRYPNPELGPFVYIFVNEDFQGFSSMDIYRLQELEVNQIVITFEGHRLFLEVLPSTNIDDLLSKKEPLILQLRAAIHFNRSLMEQLLALI